MTTRRSVIGGIIASIAAPSIVKASPRFQTKGAAEWIENMGYSYSDFIAINGIGLKDAPPWASDPTEGFVSGRAVHSGQVKNPPAGGGPSPTNMIANFNWWVNENGCKHVLTEPTEGVPNYTEQDTIISELNTAGFAASAQNMGFHMGIGWNIYHPSWFNTQMLAATTVGQIQTLMDKRLANMTVKFSPTDLIGRIDIANEFMNAGPTRQDISNNRGLLLTSCPFYTAQLAAVGASGDLLGYLDYMFTIMRAAYPDAALNWLDYNQELVQAPLIYPRMPSPYNTGTVAGAAFASQNDFAPNNQKSLRQRDKTWRMITAGVPIDTVGYQLHSNSWAPYHIEDIEASLWDYNRWGLGLCITEFNVSDVQNASNLPPQIIFQPQYMRYKYEAWYPKIILETMFRVSRVRELTWWTNALTTQTNSIDTIDNPVASMAKMVLAQTVKPSLRQLRRGHRVLGSRTYPAWLTIVGTPTIPLNAARFAVTGGTGNVQFPEAFLNDPASWNSRSLALPISKTHYIIGAQFFLTANAGTGAVLLGVSNATSGTPTNYIRMVVNSGNMLHLDIVLSGVSALSVDLGRFNLNKNHRFMVRINNNAIKVWLDGVFIYSTSIAGSFSDQVSYPLLSWPDNSGIDANTSLYSYEFHHGDDWTDDELKGLSVPDLNPNTLGIYYGRT